MSFNITALTSDIHYISFSVFTVCPILSHFQVCSNPATYFHSYQEFGHPPHPDIKVLSGNWSLYEDRPGKPGWISTKRGGVIEFNVKFGENPRLILGFLRSYEGLGDAIFSMPLINRRSVILPGIEKEQHASQTYSLNMNVKQEIFHEKFGLNGVLGWGIKPHTETKARIMAMSNMKFKLLYVIAC